VVAIFLLTSIVFIVYDCNVERSQKVVLDSANKMSAIVSALYPSAVRGKLLDHQSTNSEPNSFPKPKCSYNQTNRLIFVDETVSGVHDEEEVIIQELKPRCDIYLTTTVLFADIMGFTNWSSSTGSTRDPCDVFTVLETLYGSMDRLASRHRVFKVKTIGDCYMAVTGLSIYMHRR
jgi:Adenylate and Guanylate cyclase catalytic domain